MRGEVVGLNTLKLIKKNTTGIAFALSATDLLDVLHRFYPAPAPASGEKTEEVSTSGEGTFEKPPAAPADTGATGTVMFAEPVGAEVYIDGQFVGNIPNTIQLREGNHQIQVKDGKSPDWQKTLQVNAGSNVTLRVQFPTAN